MDFHLRSAQFLADLLDRKFGVGKLRIGLDPVIGLIPGIGDAIAFTLSLYIVWIGIQLKLPSEKIAQMMGNVVFDLFLGLIPVFGDIADVVYKANSKNLKIVLDYVNTRKNVVEGEVV